MAIADKLTQLNNVKLAIKQGLQSKLDLNLSNKAFTDYATQINTIVNRGAVTKTFTPSGSSQSYTIPKGYHNGSGKVTCNAINDLQEIKLSLSSWKSYNLGATQSAMFTMVVSSGSGNSKVTQDTTNKKVLIQFSNNGSQAGFVCKFPINTTHKSLAVHFNGGTMFTDLNNFNNWFTMGFSLKDINSPLTSLGNYDFGFESKQQWTINQFFKSGGWLGYHNGYYFILDNSYNVIAKKKASGTPKGLFFTDEKSDTGGANFTLYIDQVKYLS